MHIVQLCVSTETSRQSILAVQKSRVLNNKWLASTRGLQWTGDSVYTNKHIYSLWQSPHTQPGSALAQNIFTLPYFRKKWCIFYSTTFIWHQLLVLTVQIKSFYWNKSQGLTRALFVTHNKKVETPFLSSRWVVSSSIKERFSL